MDSIPPVPCQWNREGCGLASSGRLHLIFPVMIHLWNYSNLKLLSNLFRLSPRSSPGCGEASWAEPHTASAPQHLAPFCFPHRQKSCPMTNGLFLLLESSWGKHLQSQK